MAMTPVTKESGPLRYPCFPARRPKMAHDTSDPESEVASRNADSDRRAVPRRTARRWRRATERRARESGVLLRVRSEPREARMPEDVRAAEVREPLMGHLLPQESPDESIAKP